MEPTQDPQQPQTPGQGTSPQQPGTPTQPANNPGATVEGYAPDVNAGFAQPQTPAAIPEPTSDNTPTGQAVAVQPQTHEPGAAQGHPMSTVNQGAQQYQQTAGLPQSQLKNESIQGEDPGKTMGIAALILAFLIPLVGLILGVVARSKSKKAGHSNGLANGAIVVGIITTIISTLMTVLILLGAIAKLQENSATCEQLGPGTHRVEGRIISCQP